MNGLAHLQERYAALERAQYRQFSAGRADRMAHLLTAIRRMRDTALKTAHLAATRHPFAANS